MREIMKFYTEEDKVKVTGRTLFRQNIRYLGYSASSVSFRFTGRQASARLISDPDNWPQEQYAWIAVYYNNETEPAKRIALTQTEQDIVLYESESEDTVTVTIMKYSEPEYAICGIAEITIDSDNLLPPPAPKQRKLQIIGDSITCGYGIEGSLAEEMHRTATENPAKAYSVLTANALDADLEIVAWNGKGVITSYVGEDVNTPDASWLVPMLYQYTDAGCCSQYFHEPKENWEKWDYSRFVPDLILINLGTNDASYTRQIAQREEEFCTAYQDFLLDVHTKHPHAKILCTLGTMDQRLCPSVARAVTEFSADHPEAEVSFLALPPQLEEDGLGTFWHPTPATHRKAADLLISRAKELMKW